ncbi:MAG: DUF4276 family protein [Alphaproteobacteria bacterium]|nr:MAG: DUF4276 family protein [Alphaproteobacteria bacterium]
MREVPARLRGYARSFNKADLRIVLLLDRDRDDCKILKQRLEGAAHEAGLPTRSRPHPSGQVSVLTRIVVVELESWFLGDPDALTAAFPKLGSLNPAKPPLRDPDQGTWEALERLLQRGGYPGRYAKIAGARRIAANMEPARNASPSFQSFRQGLHDLLAGPSGLRAD